MKVLPILAVLALTGCTGGSSPTTSPTTTTTTTTIVQATTTVAPPVECPPAPYRVGSLPERVSPNQIPAENLAIDEFTSIPGTHSTIWVGDDGDMVVALIRGTLPPRDWPGEKGEVFIDGARGVAGPFEDGAWVVAWFEAPGGRCDLYTMVFYPPIEPSEVEATVNSLDRVAG